MCYFSNAAINNPHAPSGWKRGTHISSQFCRLEVHGQHSLPGSLLKSLTRLKSSCWLGCIPFWKLRAWICFKVPSWCGPGSISSNCRTEVPFSLLAVSWGLCSISRGWSPPLSKAAMVGGVFLHSLQISLTSPLSPLLFVFPLNHVAEVWSTYKKLYITDVYNLMRLGISTQLVKPNTSQGFLQIFLL